MNVPFSIDINLQWGEMDALGHINNTLYFRYFESARIAWFSALGYGEVNAGSEQGPVLASVSCQFLRPLFFPDTIRVGCKIERIGNTSMQMTHEIFSHEQQTVVSKGDSIIVMVNYQTGEKIPVSEELKNKIYLFHPELKG